MESGSLRSGGTCEAKRLQAAEEEVEQIADDSDETRHETHGDSFRWSGAEALSVFLSGTIPTVWTYCFAPQAPTKRLDFLSAHGVMFG